MRCCEPTGTNGPTLLKTFQPPPVWGGGMGSSAHNHYAGSRPTRHTHCLRPLWGCGGVWGVDMSCGGHGVGETPGSIPNPEAKPHSADGTAPGRVWESRTPPHHSSGVVGKYYQCPGWARWCFPTTPSFFPFFHPASVFAPVRLACPCTPSTPSRAPPNTQDREEARLKGQMKRASKGK